MMIDTDAVRGLAPDFDQAAAQVLAASATCDGATGLNVGDCGIPPLGPLAYALNERQRADARDGSQALARDMRSFAQRLRAVADNSERADQASA